VRRLIAVPAMAHSAPAPGDPLPCVDVELPDIARWARGNTGIPYVWRFASGAAGPHVTVQALTHGNEVCGAIALDWLLNLGIRPTRGTLTLVFANAAAYRTFDRADPYAARCLDEDFNRLWDEAVLASTRRTQELARARALRPLYDETDLLLDLHSMTDACVPLALAGRQPKGVDLARGVGVPQSIVVDAGHRAGRRLRDYAAFDDAGDPRAALLVECGQHFERSSPGVARQCMLRFLRHAGVVDRSFVDAFIDPTPPPPQRVIEIVDVVTVETAEFAFTQPVAGMTTIGDAGTLLARDGPREIRTPCDDCVLIMPARRAKAGETAVRLGRFVA
jgi:predicted deacylase